VSATRYKEYRIMRDACLRHGAHGNAGGDGFFNSRIGIVEKRTLSPPVLRVATVRTSGFQSLDRQADQVRGSLDAELDLHVCADVGDRLVSDTEAVGDGGHAFALA
jgi:hypothetical protein